MDISVEQFHHKELGTKRAVVAAEVVHLRDGHIGLGQGLHDLKFAGDLMRAWQQLAHRFGAQDVRPFAGGDFIGRV